MKILITGAAGKIGSATCKYFVERDHQVIGIDKLYKKLSGVEMHVDSLTNADRLYPLLEGCDAVVHLANYPNESDPDFTMTYTNNVAANMAVFHAACDVGVPRVIFISSIQVCSTAHTVADGPCKLPYLPIDHQLPQRPDNLYSLGKAASENALEFFCDHRGLTGVALRLPYTLPLYALDHIVRRMHRKPHGTWRLDEAYAYLVAEDAASLIHDCVVAESLEGYNVFLAAAPNPFCDATPSELRANFYNHVPWQGGDDPEQSLIDISALTEATGWRPRHIVTKDGLTILED